MNPNIIDLSKDLARVTPQILKKSKKDNLDLYKWAEIVNGKVMDEDLDKYFDFVKSICNGSLYREFPENSIGDCLFRQNLLRLYINATNGDNKLLKILNKLEKDMPKLKDQGQNFKPLQQMLIASATASLQTMDPVFE